MGESDYEVYFQIRGVTHKVETWDLSEAETLNGLQWKGQVRFASRVCRKYEHVKDSPQVPKWSEWENGGPLINGSVDILSSYESYQFTKKNGQWMKGYESGSYQKQFFTKPSEEQIKKIL
jgi:hypothetical protein